MTITAITVLEQLNSGGFKTEERRIGSRGHWMIYTSVKRALVTAVAMGCAKPGRCVSATKDLLASILTWQLVVDTPKM